MSRKTSASAKIRLARLRVARLRIARIVASLTPEQCAQWLADGERSAAERRAAREGKAS